MSALLLKPVIVSVDWFRPAYRAGGPVASLDNLFRLCSDEFEFYVICSAYDLGKVPLQNIPLNTWTYYAKNVNVFYRSNNRNGKIIWKDIFKRFPDAPLYINGMFSWHYSILPLWFRSAVRKTIIAPRGMLSGGAIVRGYYKKLLFLKCAKGFKLYANARFQATDTEELKAIQNILQVSKQAVFQVSNVPKAIFNEAHTPISGKRLCMISRIHPIKNTLGAIRIVKQLAAYNVPFDIYGPIEDSAYWAQCQLEMQSAPNIRYCGEVAPDNVVLVLNTYNILLHPSFNENFGHSIAEALQCQVAVLTGDATPWNWLNETGGGAAINPLHEDIYVKTLKVWLEMNDSEFLEFCKRGTMAFRSRFSLNELKLKYRHLFYAS